MNTNWFECLTHLRSLKLGNTGKYDQPTSRKLLMTLSFFLINIALLWNFSWREITQRCYTYLKNKKYPVFKFLCIFSQFFHGIFFKKIFNSCNKISVLSCCNEIFSRKSSLLWPKAIFRFLLVFHHSGFCFFKCFYWS